MPSNILLFLTAFPFSLAMIDLDTISFLNIIDEGRCWSFSNFSSNWNILK